VLDSAPVSEVRLGDFHEAVQETKKQLIRAAVAEASGNITKAAARLGLQPTYLHRLIRNLDLRGEIQEK
jgi:transcriptional regulator with GAF, ATPase, and Fis domain